MATLNEADSLSDHQEQAALEAEQNLSEIKAKVMSLCLGNTQKDLADFVNKTLKIDDLQLNESKLDGSDNNNIVKNIRETVEISCAGQTAEVETLTETMDAGDQVTQSDSKPQDSKVPTGKSITMEITTVQSKSVPSKVSSSQLGKSLF